MRRYLDEVWSQGNIPVACEVVAEVYVDHTPPSGSACDRAGLLELVEAFHAAFALTDFSVDALVAEGDTVVDQWTLCGVHKGEFWGVPATGKSFTLRGMDFHTVREGQIVETWHIEDLLGMMRQLELISSPSAPGR